MLGLVLCIRLGSLHASVQQLHAESATINPIFKMRKPRLGKLGNLFPFIELLSRGARSQTHLFALQSQNLNHCIVFHGKTFCANINGFGLSTPGTIGTIL